SYEDAAEVILDNLSKNGRFSSRRVGVALPPGLRKRQSRRLCDLLSLKDASISQGPMLSFFISSTATASAKPLRSKNTVPATRRSMVIPHVLDSPRRKARRVVRHAPRLCRYL